MIRGRQVTFFDVISRARLADAAEQIDAKPVHGVSRPAATIALQFERLLRGEHAAATSAFGVEQEIALFPKQPESVADLPGNLQRQLSRARRGFAGDGGRGLRYRGARRERRQRGSDQCQSNFQTVMNSRHTAFDVTVGAEI
jgi:hypothetical protein